ncbi:MAG: hypothetical protein OQK35_01315 [Alphaproteobacteria bacterium]|nr:hypothetical protein [Alphaproteobacteria bacterium]
MAYDNFSLGAVQRSTIYERQRISDVRQESSNRLATGLRVNQASDAPRDFFRAQALTSRISNLLDTKADIGRGIDTLAATQVGLDSVEKFSQQLKGLAISAQSADASGRTEIAAQFDTIRSQLDLLVGDISYQGANLLSNPADSLRVSVSDSSGGRFTIDGQASDTASLGVGTAATDFNGFASQADIDAAILAVESAITEVQSNSSRIGSNAAILNIRESFTQDLANTLQTGVDKLINADLNQEAARSLAANVQDGLAQEGQRITAQAEGQIVDLVRSLS